MRLPLGRAQQLLPDATDKETNDMSYAQRRWQGDSSAPCAKTRLCQRRRGAAGLGTARGGRASAGPGQDRGVGAALVTVGPAMCRALQGSAGGRNPCPQQPLPSPAPLPFTVTCPARRHRPKGHVSRLSLSRAQLRIFFPSLHTGELEGRINLIKMPRTQSEFVLIC